VYSPKKNFGDGEGGMGDEEEGKTRVIWQDGEYFRVRKKSW
jgi:hypothetical protein